MDRHKITSSRSPLSVLCRSWTLRWPCANTHLFLTLRRRRRCFRLMLWSRCRWAWSVSSDDLTSCFTAVSSRCCLWSDGGGSGSETELTLSVRARRRSGVSKPLPHPHRTPRKRGRRLHGGAEEVQKRRLQEATQGKRVSVNLYLFSAALAVFNCVILQVIFVGEEAVDAGGVRKEFFLLIMKELLDPKYGMFRYYEESRLIWFAHKVQYKKHKCPQSVSFKKSFRIQQNQFIFFWKKFFFSELLIFFFFVTD